MPRKRPRLKVPIVDDYSPGDEYKKIFATLLVYISIAVHLPVFIILGFRTLIPTNLLIILFIFEIIITWFILKKRNVQKPGLKSLFWGPLIFNILLSVNYFVSFNLHEEKYNFSQDIVSIADTRTYSSQPARSSVITLENDAYNYYWGLRTFFDYSRVPPGGKICFIFKTGLFGIRVLSDYHF